jgi:hypothetical protein
MENRNAILNLTKDDIGMLVELASNRKTQCIQLAHEKPDDEFHRNELTKIKRIHRELLIAFQQKA